MKNKGQYLLFGCVLIILIYLSPYLLWGQDCLIKTGDNLDSNIPWLMVMASNVHRLGWNYDVAPQVMNGIPKYCLGSQLNVIFCLYYLFPPFIAYVVNLFLMHFIAFIGMLLLLKQIMPDNNEKEFLIICGTALCFALLDFWPSGGLSIAGQPLLLYALLRIKEGDFKVQHFAVVVLFPLYSSFVLAGVFVLFVLFSWSLYELLSMKRNHWQFYFAILLFSAICLFSEHKLLSDFFGNNGFVSHRAEFSFPGVSFFGAFRASLQLWLFGLSSHANVFQYPLIVGMILLAAIVSLAKKSRQTTPFYPLLAFTICLAIIGGFYHWSGFHGLKHVFPVFKTFDLSRFTFLLPPAFFMLFFYALWIVFQRRKKAAILMVALLCLQVGLAFKRNASDRTFYHKLRSLVSAGGSNATEITYRSYYSESLYRKIKEFIGIEPNRYRVLSLGVDPGIALYNGFYVLDAYVANYPLEYKKRFRRIIENELGKNEVIRRMFDDFGSTCYLYSAEIGPRSVTWYEDLRVSDLRLNRAALREMGCNYILSAVEIVRPEASGLAYMMRFDDEDSLWRIHLYRCLARENG